MSSHLPERHGYRRARRAGQPAAPVRMAPILSSLPCYEVLDAEALERVHQASMRILSEFGIAFYDAETRGILRDHGARVEDDMAYCDPGLVEEYVARAPSQFVQRARNVENHVVIGGNSLVFAPVYGPPSVLDLAHQRREATLEDCVNFVKLSSLSPYSHHSGGTVVEPADAPVATRHLDMVFSHIKYSDKAFMGAVTSAEHAADTVAMTEMLFGSEAIGAQPGVLALINVSSPRRFDERMLGALNVYARARQGLIITPFILAGAMGPTTIPLARRYRLPFRGGGMFSSAKIPDAQAGYESVMAMLPTVLARTNFVLHAAGWLDNGLVAGYEKFVLDCELLGMLHTWAKGIDVSEESLALEAIAAVPPGGHHLGTAHTMRHFRTAFYRAALFDYDAFEQ